MATVIIRKPEISVTDKDIELVQLLVNGAKRPEIGLQLGISVRTVEDRLDKLRAKTGCNSIPYLIGEFFRNNLIE